MATASASATPQQQTASARGPAAASGDETPPQKQGAKDEPERQTVSPAPQIRIPRQRYRGGASLQGQVITEDGRDLAGVVVTLRDQRSGRPVQTQTNGEGVFRVTDLAPGSYQLQLSLPGFDEFTRNAVQLNTAEVLSIEVRLHENGTKAAPTGPMDRPLAGAIPPNAGQENENSYRELRRRPDENAKAEAQSEQTAPTEDEVFRREDDRWNIAMPYFKRYDRPGEYVVVQGHWYDPFNRNKLKGDYPVFGNREFFKFTGMAVTAIDGRQLPTPSLVAAARPGSQEFFGRPGQFFLSQTFRFSAELFRGDAGFRPADWRIHFTPALNINYLAVQERGIVNVNPQFGTTRTDLHVGLQEGFVEYKVKEFNPNYDFLSVRAGIQQFASDFRGLVYTEEQPGLRVFGNLKSDKIEYNAAYFYHLEKDTNSGLNTFDPRDQQVIVGNVYFQDFLYKGYTTEFSYHFNKDDGGLYFNTNGLITRPAPIGLVKVHHLSTHYIGWASNGHIKRINVSHAFYQVLGHDSSNAFASATSVGKGGTKVDVNAQMAALELSLDKDWARFRASFYYASGDSRPTDGVARGYDSIVESQTFAGGPFSFWNREGIRLTATAIGLKSPNSLFPDLRASKEEGQANYVNPGVFVYNLGGDFDITPKMRWVVNANVLSFVHTEPLQLALFQNRIHRGIGADYGTGVIYRPPLSENIIIEAGVSALSPFQGLRDIYTGKTLVSGFALVKFVF